MDFLKTMSLSTRVLIGLGLVILLGLLIGEWVGPLGIVANDVEFSVCRVFEIVPEGLFFCRAHHGHELQCNQGNNRFS